MNKKEALSSLMEILILFYKSTIQKKLQVHNI